MTKRALLAVVGLCAFCFAASAEQPARIAQGHHDALTLAQLHQLAPASGRPLFLQPTFFNRLDNPLLVDGFAGPANFLSRETFSLATTFNLLGTPTSFLPTTMAPESPGRPLPATSGKDSSDYPLDLRQNYYVTGEVGFLYGRSSGKFGGDYKEAYIIGEVGNDKIHISVGAAYEDWSGRIPRWGR